MRQRDFHVSPGGAVAARPLAALLIVSAFQVRLLTCHEIGGQMPHLILAHDHEGMEAKREEVRDAHRRHLAAQGTKLLASGALLAADGRTVIGGASLFDTDDYQEAARFEADDPYAKAGIRARVEIVEWRLRWWLGRFNAGGHQPK